MKLPSIQFYPGDWHKDPGIQSLNYHQRGIWFEILLLMHESEERGKLLLNGKPMPEAALANVLHLDIQEVNQILTTLLDYGIASKDESSAIINRRMIRDENLRKIRKNCGKLGGNPVLLNQKPTTGVNQVPTPSSSSSSSSSSSKKEGFTKPNAQEVSEYAKSIGFSLDGERFLDYYTVRGWKLSGGVSMKDWKAAVRTWKRTQIQGGAVPKAAPTIRPSYSDLQEKGVVK